MKTHCGIGFLIGDGVLPVGVMSSTADKEWSDDRWLIDSKRLSQEQLRELRAAIRRPEPALDVADLELLRDPADRAIVATARVHRLRLLTSDQRIATSGLVPVVE
jgi:PIN domain nuclease of toxin-antitoxin system